MCENIFLERVETAIRERVNSAETFTAYTITQELREVGISAPHDAVRALVHLMFGYGRLGGAYTRTLCDVGGERGAAWVYHHCENDPRKFATRLRRTGGHWSRMARRL